MVDEGRELESRVPSNSTSSASPTYVPIPLVNTTQLAQACLDICKGGVCQQSTLTGATVCTSCAAGFTLDPLTHRCEDGSQCAQWHWCTTQDTILLKAYHSTIQLVGQSTNYTTVTDASGTVDAFVNLIATGGGYVSYTDTRDAANLYFQVKKQLLSQNSSLEVAPYWDDQHAGLSTLQIYQITLSQPYAEYISRMKAWVCPLAWTAQGSACIAPM